MRNTRRTRTMSCAVLVAALALTACGVRYSDPEPGTEFFESITVSGNKTVASTLTVVVGYTQNYPVEVEAVCELRQNEKTLREIGRDLVPPLPEGNPDATPTNGSLTHDFTVETAGTYVVECLTPKDEDNYIAKEITIS